MKKPVVTIAVLVALLLIYWLVQTKDNKVETNRPFIAADSAKISLLRIESGGELVELAKEGDKWRLKKPIDYPANDKIVAGALAKFKEMNKLAMITSKPEKQSEYQVDDSAGVKVTVSQDGKEQSVILGKTGPLGSTTYARIPSKNEVWEIGGNQTSAFKKKAKDWRDKTITDFDMNSVTKISLEYPKETTTLTLVDSVWKVESGSQKFDGEKSFVERVTRLLAKMSGVDFVDSLKSNSFDNAEFRLSAQTSDGQQVDLRFMPTDSTGNQYFVRKQGATSDFLIYKSTANALMKKPEDFRPKPDEAKPKGA